MAPVAGSTLTAVSDASANPAAKWYPDPLGRHELRYWDGGQWTDHVSSSGTTAVDPLDAPPVPVGTDADHQVQRQVREQARLTSATVGGGTIFTEPVLVVNQKAKIIEVNSEYAIYDQNGGQVGAVRQVGQSSLKKASRVLSNVDQFMTHRFQVVDMTGTVHLVVTRPRKLVKSRIEISDGEGRPVGQVVQQNMMGKINFSMEVGGQSLGSIKAENWRAWNFMISDTSGTEVARITKTWEGMAKTMFTTADNYVLQVHNPIAEPLRSLVIASALSIDTALKQDARGLS